MDHATSTWKSRSTDARPHTHSPILLSRPFLQSSVFHIDYTNRPHSRFSEAGRKVISNHQLRRRRGYTGFVVHVHAHVDRRGPLGRATVKVHLRSCYRYSMVSRRSSSVYFETKGNFYHVYLSARKTEFAERGGGVIGTEIDRQCIFIATTRELLFT